MNKKEIINACEKNLAIKRATAQNKAYLNLIDARKNPKFVECEKHEKSLTFEIGKLKAFNLNFQHKQKELDKIKEEKSAILKEIGLVESDLSPNYECKTCNDIGYAGNRMCNCLKNKINDEIIKECAQGKEKLNSFDNFNAEVAKTPEHKDQLLKLKIKFSSFADKFPHETPKFILLTGNTGVGKTFLTECLATALIKKGNLVSFISAFGMNNMFLSYHTAFSDDKQTYINALLDPDVLVIDDLGTEPILKNVTKEYLYLILSERSIQNKLTVITTNLLPKEIMDRYNERISSRLFNKRESFLAQIVGSDLRLTSKK